MRECLKSLLALAMLSAATLAAAVPRTEETAGNGEPARATFVDLTDDFARLHDATEGLPEAERVQAFKQRVLPLFPSFYGIERFEGRATWEQRDRQIANALARFPEQRAAYLAKAAQFGADLDENIASFRQAFSDFSLTTPIYLLHSLGEMDGGTRDFDGRTYLIFGADGMVRYHAGWESESAFFHHELFHTYHQQRLGDCEPVWCVLWIEGLAVHVAQRLNPDASEPELLLDFPAGMAAATRAVLVPSLEHLKTVLDSEDDATMNALFSSGTDATGLPSRRGYYLGWLIAQRIGNDRDLAELANLPRERVRPLLEAAIDDLLSTP
ncbi:hypothetical protein [Pseudoxanthomonas putridarboris]|uniref:DUF2268 domain-containing protein n=1 Tax=Pseudoxanthomonas putridarboris TaxID=752605 RepID=A0ABU9J258_9GAMM